MHQITIHQAKTHLSRLIQAALAGEEVVIAKGKQPLVKRVVVPKLRQQRRIGGAEGVVLFIADDFDAPLQDLQEHVP
jgi:antitoxin (DNA-binding transcriptional repressor) of toxin-antitoxin stability system